MSRKAWSAAGFAAQQQNERQLHSSPKHSMLSEKSKTVIVQGLLTV